MPQRTRSESLLAYLSVGRACGLITDRYAWVSRYDGDRQQWHHAEWLFIPEWLRARYVFVEPSHHVFESFVSYAIWWCRIAVGFAALPLLTYSIVRTG